jgi:SPP1 gp7 family putative phage head morphogenesis protein
MAPTPEYLKLSPQEAIAYFRQKIPIPTEHWYDFDAEQHDFAYTVSSLTRADLLEAMQWLIDQAIAEGVSFDTFSKQFRRLVQRRGWTPDPLPAGPSDWRLRIIFETPIRRAYAAGRRKQMKDPAVMRMRPYWLWRHGDSPNARPLHQSLHNQVFRADDPFWDVAFPPCGYGCKCRAYSVGDRQIKERGLSVGKPPDPYTIAQKGFQRAPGATPVEERQEVLERGLERLSPNLREQVEKDLSQRQERTDSTQRRIWVNDKRVKDGGYYRRVRMGAEKEKTPDHKGYLVWFEGRRTCVAVAANSKKEAIAIARQRKKRGGDKVVKVRRPTPAEVKIAEKGKWIRTGPNGEKPGEGDTRGFGPKPKAYREAADTRYDDKRTWVDDDSVENGGYWRRYKEGKQRTKISPFVTRKELSHLSKVTDSRYTSGVNDSFFVQNPEGKRSVLKKNTSPLETAAEVLITELADSIGAPINRVRLIPGSASLSEEFNRRDESPIVVGSGGASLHDLVPGQPCRNIEWDAENPGTRLSLQITDSLNLNRERFYDALSSPDLAKIMALDVFSGNPDRHSGNLFYDRNKGFSGIDHGFAFTSGTAAEIVYSLKKEVIQPSQDGRYDVKNLEVFVSSLKTLTEEHPPSSIVKRLQIFSNAASSGQFNKAIGSDIVDEKRVKQGLQSRTDIISYNHRKSLELIQILEPQIKKRRTFFGGKK